MDKAAQREILGSQADPVSETEPTGVTVRAVFLGLVLVVCVNAFMIYTEYVIRASANNYSHFPIYVFCSFAMLTLLGLPLMRWFTGRQVLSRSEVFTILIMGFVAGVVPSNGLTGFLIVVIATPFYFATPENHWAEIFHGHIPSWIAPRDPETVRGFFEGLPPGAPIPWAAWVGPLFWWMCFVVAVFGLSASIAAILKRQWVHHERLTYPLVGVAEDLTEGLEDGAGMPKILRDRRFWMGFSLAFGMLAWNMIGYFSVGFPHIPLEGRSFPIARDYPSIQTRINLFVIGFAYFANLDVLFSIWVFRLLYILQVGLFNRLGYPIGGGEDSWSAGLTGWQSFGALIAMVLWRLWIARDHLRAVVQKALDPAHPLDDRDGMMSCRTALVVLLFCCVFCIAWLWQAGMGIGMILIYGVMSILLYIGIARIVAESGLLYVRGPLTAQAFSLYLLGSGAVGPAAVTASAFTYTTISQGQGLFFTMLTQVARLEEFMTGNRRRILGAVALAFFVALVTSVGVTLYLGYTYGTFNFQTWHIKSGGRQVFGATANRILAPFSTDIRRLSFFGMGAVIMGLLTLLRYRIPGWPLHPIGFTVGCTYFTQKTFVSVFFAWACKYLILRFGGVMLYRRMRPLFVGLLVGYALGVALSGVIDIIWFPGQGHYIHSV
ncbi:MAG: hypothetical protein HOE48_22680 [Candidatus Latescibacteria bacterium]|nr:hypothetical protein [Candidatus Latescibacterota bacterium]